MAGFLTRFICRSDRLRPITSRTNDKARFCGPYRCSVAQARKKSTSRGARNYKSAPWDIFVTNAYSHILHSATTRFVTIGHYRL